jgi:hypothetical protein
MDSCPFSEDGSPCEYNYDGWESYHPYKCFAKKTVREQCIAWSMKRG